MWTAVCFALAMVALGPAAGGQEVQPPNPPSQAESPPEGRVATEVTAERIEAIGRQLEAATDLTDDQRQRAQEWLRRAGESVKAASELMALERQAVQRQEKVQEDRQHWETLFQQLQRTPIDQAWLGDSLANLEQTLARKQAELAQAQADLDRVQTRINQRLERQRLHRERLAENPRELEGIRQQLERLPASADPPLVVESQRTALLAEQRRLELEPGALQRDLAAIAAQDAVNLPQLERQYQAERVARLREEVDDWSTAAGRRRRLDTEDRLEVARSLAARADLPVLRGIYQENAASVERELAVRLETQQSQAKVLEFKDVRESLESQWEQLRSRESRLLGNRLAFGLRLRQQRQELDAVADPILLRRGIHQGDQILEDAHLEHVDWKERRKVLDRFEQVLEQRLRSTISSELSSDDDVRQVEAEIRSALEQQRSFLDHIDGAFEDYIETLETLDSEQKRLMDLSVRFRQYIDERVLWIPSHGPLTLESLADDTESLRRLSDFTAWKQAGGLIATDFRGHVWMYLLAGVMWGTLLATQGRLRQIIRAHGQKAASRLNTSMRPTLAALSWTFVKSLTIPLPLLFLSLRLRLASLPPQPLHLQLLGTYVMLVGIALLALEFVRNVSRTHGLGAAHFGWSKRVNDLISRQDSWFLVFAAPPAIVAAILHSRREDGGTDALERTLLIVVSLLLAYVLHRLTSRQGGIIQEWIDERPGGWLDKLSGLWHFVATSIPMLLAGLTAAGYTYAAQRLSVRLIQSLLLMYGAVFLRAILLRWLTLRQRRLAVEQARQIRASAMASVASDPEGGPAPVHGVQEAQTKLADVSSQARRMLNTTVVVVTLGGLWYVWSDMVPALRYFDTWMIPTTEISLARALSSIVIIMLTVIAARNLPGLLEFTLLEKLPLDKSVRYAVGSLTQYVIFILGLLMVSDLLGIRWEQVQWLAAALTFGLGFGLQEIFANFVSGVIILFEQPARVGDVVTIDGVTGSVTRIRIRSTTIMDWDRKEYIVPNKEFITGRLLNWTLTDTLNRITIKVGVSYDADPEKVRELILETVKTQEHVLADPEPRVFFDGFGDSSLNFTTFAFLSTLEHRLATTHALHSRILKSFRQAGIEIPFSQHDLHVRSIVPIPGLSPADPPQFTPSATSEAPPD